ncbi:MAG: hypothetical protein ACFFAU_04230 [Candidatus Hodarchaeota archaeon]
MKFHIYILVLSIFIFLKEKTYPVYLILARLALVRFTGKYEHKSHDFTSWILPFKVLKYFLNVNLIFAEENNKQLKKLIQIKRKDHSFFIKEFLFHRSSSFALFH